LYAASVADVGLSKWLFDLAGHANELLLAMLTSYFWFLLAIFSSPADFTEAGDEPLLVLGLLMLSRKSSLDVDMLLACSCLKEVASQLIFHLDSSKGLYAICEVVVQLFSLCLAIVPRWYFVLVGLF
jgi:hypothetical protein